MLILGNAHMQLSTDVTSPLIFSGSSTGLDKSLAKLQHSCCKLIPANGVEAAQERELCRARKKREGQRVCEAQ